MFRCFQPYLMKDIHIFDEGFFRFHITSILNTELIFAPPFKVKQVITKPNTILYAERQVKCTWYACVLTVHGIFFIDSPKV